MKFETFVGGRYLRTRGKQTFVSVISLISLAGFTVGVAALIIVLAVLTGFEDALKSKILGINPHVMVLKFGGGIDDPAHVIDVARKTPGVAEATPFVYAQIMLKNDVSSAGVVVRGIDPATAPKVIDVLAKLASGSLADLAPGGKGKPGGVILGKDLAGQLSVGVGDRVDAVSPRGSITPFGPAFSSRPLTVVGIFDSGMHEYDNSLCYVHLAEGQSLLGFGNQVTGVELRLTDPYEAEAIATHVQETLGFPYSTRNWIRMNKSLFEAFALERFVYFMVVLLITLVAGFNIVSTLIMTVLEKTKDIAILKSMGASAKSIRKIFQVEGLTVGLAGTAIGVSVGLLTALNLTRLARGVEAVCHCKIIPEGVFYINEVPSKVNPLDVVIVAVVAIAISYLATIYPSWQASRLDPAEALRYE